MKMIKYLLLFTFIFTLFSCSRQYKLAKIEPGSTSISEAISLLDEPTNKDESLRIEGSMLYIWKDVSLQIDKEKIVQAIHRAPASHEQNLQFWRHEYKDTITELNKLPHHNLWQFDIPKKGINVIYDEKADLVTKVILYEAK